jgi:hypothetical protein
VTTLSYRLTQEFATLHRLVFKDLTKPPNPGISAPWVGFVPGLQTRTQSYADAAALLSHVWTRCSIPGRGRELGRLWSFWTISSKLGSLLLDQRTSLVFATRRPDGKGKSESPHRRVGRIRWVDLGGQPGSEGSLPPGLGADRHRAPYVFRTAHVELWSRIQRAIASNPEHWQDRVVLAVGPPQAGNTRSVLEGAHPTGAPRARTRQRLRPGQLSDPLDDAQFYGYCDTESWGVVSEGGESWAQGCGRAPYCPMKGPPETTNRQEKCRSNHTDPRALNPSPPSVPRFLAPALTPSPPSELPGTPPRILPPHS